MIIIYNLAGIGLGAAAAVIALAIFLICGLGHGGWFVLLTGLIGVGLDVWYRRKHQSKWFSPSSGGSFFFLPLWLLSGLVAMFGLLMLTVPERPSRDLLTHQNATSTRETFLPTAPPHTPLVPALKASNVSPDTNSPTDHPEVPSPPLIPLLAGSPASVSGEGTAAVDSELPSKTPRGRESPSSSTRGNSRPEPPSPRPAFRSEDPGDITKETLLTVGQNIETKWGHTWYPSEVIELLADGRVKIHYIGWSAGSDETVERVRLRTARGKVAADGRGPTRKLEFGVDGSGEITQATPLTIGQKVETKWGSTWFASEVMDLLADGKVKVHYAGWSSGSDETVERTRLRNPRGVVRSGGGR